METILLTGAAGFIGSHLAERLLSLGHRVIGLDNYDPFYDRAIKLQNIAIALKNSNYSIVEGDIRDYESLKSLFLTGRIQKIIHLAARAGVRPSIQEPLLYEEVNVKGTLNLLELSRHYAVEQFIFASSSSVYGGNRKVPFSENDSVDCPISPYAATKKCGELLCYNYFHHNHFPITCLRFFTVYGPRQRPEMAIHQFAKAILENKAVRLYGDGTVKRDFTFIEDIIDGIALALRYPNGYQIYNLGESETYSMMEVVDLLSKLANKRAKIEFLSPEPGDMPITFADISKARAELGYRPKTRLEEGLKLFVDWLNNYK